MKGNCNLLFSLVLFTFCLARAMEKPSPVISKKDSKTDRKSQDIVNDPTQSHRDHRLTIDNPGQRLADLTGTPPGSTDSLPTPIATVPPSNAVSKTQSLVDQNDPNFPVPPNNEVGKTQSVVDPNNLYSSIAPLVLKEMPGDKDWDRTFDELGELSSKAVPILLGNPLLPKERVSKSGSGSGSEIVKSKDGEKKSPVDNPRFVTKVIPTTWEEFIMIYTSKCGKAIKTKLNSIYNDLLFGDYALTELFRHFEITKGAAYGTDRPTYKEQLNSSIKTTLEKENDALRKELKAELNSRDRALYCRAAGIGGVIFATQIVTLALVASNYNHCGA